jgi:hypothetical protein
LNLKYKQLYKKKKSIIFLTQVYFYWLEGSPRTAHASRITIGSHTTSQSECIPQRGGGCGSPFILFFIIIILIITKKNYLYSNSRLFVSSYYTYISPVYIFYYIRCFFFFFLHSLYTLYRSNLSSIFFEFSRSAYIQNTEFLHIAFLCSFILQVRFSVSLLNTKRNPVSLLLCILSELLLARTA